MVYGNFALFCVGAIEKKPTTFDKAWNNKFQGLKRSGTKPSIKSLKR
jgi:hypothetical protein